MIVKVINKSHHALPQYETIGSAGLDIRANLGESFMLEPGQFKLVPTGLHIELPVGYEAQVRPRSGLAYKHGVTVLNSPGTIDADYRGDVGVILINHSKIAFEVKDGERIAQLVVAKHEVIEWETTEELGSTDRGAGGFGSTGKK